MTTPEGPRGTAAELLAAVRAVESGERPAASFFTRPEPAAPGGRQPAGPGARAPQGGRQRAPQQEPAAGRGPVAGAGSVPAPAPAHVPVPVHVPEELDRLLAASGAPAAAVAGHFGEQAAGLLREDPWRLLSVPGVRPDQADGFARTLLGDACGPQDPRRGRALVDWVLRRAAQSGHTVLDSAALYGGLAPHGVPDPEEAVREAVEDGTVLVFRETAPTDQETDGQPAPLLFGLERYAIAEESLADGLARLTATFRPPGDPSPDGEAAAVAAPGRGDWERAAAAAGPAAAELIRAAAGGAVTAHTGGEAARAEPAALVAAVRALGLRACAAAHGEDGRARLAALVTAACERSGAPTGTPVPGETGESGHTSPGAVGVRAADLGSRAAPEGTRAAAGGAGAADEAGPGAATGSGAAPQGTEEPGTAGWSPAAGAAVTVAGLLAGDEGPGRDEDGALALDVLVVLDAPLLDAETAASLVESLPDGARLVLSGDPQLLGAAGAGRPWDDLLASRAFPRVASRTPDPGPIGELVSGVGIGELNRVEAPHREVVIVPVRDAGEAVHRTVQLVTDSVPRAIGVPTEHTQVITPGHGGAAGTRVLNAALKEALNPGPGRFGGFDPGDRVAYSRTPGRTTMGTVVAGDGEGLHLDCTGRSVAVPPQQVARTVRHGWAVTAHQAAGIRWPAAVVVLPGDAGQVLDRTWVYTAFSRGERHLSVVHGAGQALPAAVAGAPAAPRRTRLRSLLHEQQAAAGGRGADGTGSGVRSPA